MKQNELQKMFEQGMQARLIDAKKELQETKKLIAEKNRKMI